MRKKAIFSHSLSINFYQLCPYEKWYNIPCYRVLKNRSSSMKYYVVAYRIRLNNIPPPFVHIVQSLHTLCTFVHFVQSIPTHCSNHTRHKLHCIFIHNIQSSPLPVSATRTHNHHQKHKNAIFSTF